MNDPWISDEEWMACASPEEYVVEKALYGRRCFLGLHVAPEMESVSICAVFPPIAKGEPWKLAWRFFASLDFMKKRERHDYVPYVTWLSKGQITPLDGTALDQERVSEHILSLASHYEVVEVAYDSWKSVELVAQLSSSGLPLVPIRQSFSPMSGYTASFERMVRDRTLLHDGNPIARWMLRCTEVKTDRQRHVMPMVPQRDSGQRIDGILAAIMAIGRAGAETREPERQKEADVKEKSKNAKTIAIIKALDSLGYEVFEVKPEYAEGINGTVGTTGATLLKIAEKEASE